MEHHPGHEVDEADAGGEQRHDLGGAEYFERYHVQEGGQRPQQAEQKAPDEEGP